MHNYNQCFLSARFVIMLLSDLDMHKMTKRINRISLINSETKNLEALDSMTLLRNKPISITIVIDDNTGISILPINPFKFKLQYFLHRLNFATLGQITISEIEMQ